MLSKLPIEIREIIYKLCWDDEWLAYCAEKLCAAAHEAPCLSQPCRCNRQYYIPRLLLEEFVGLQTAQEAGASFYGSSNEESKFVINVAGVVPGLTNDDFHLRLTPAHYRTSIVIVVKSDVRIGQ
jgi:hypothetical protein